MPSHPSVPGVCVQVVLGKAGPVLMEYVDPEEPDPKGPKLIERWVESRPQTFFAIRIGYNRLFRHKRHGVKEIISLDGDEVFSSTPVHSAQSVKGWTADRDRANKRALGKRGRFKFMPLINEDKLDMHDTEALKRRYKDLGTIKVQLFKVHAKEQKEGSDSWDLQGAFYGQEVPEQAYKGRDMDLKAVLDDSQNAENDRLVKCVPKYETLKPSQKPFVTFVFHYRGERILKYLRLKPLPESVIQSRREKRKHIQKTLKDFPSPSPMAAIDEFAEVEHGGVVITGTRLLDRTERRRETQKQAQELRQTQQSGDQQNGNGNQESRLFVDLDGDENGAYGGDDIEIIGHVKKRGAPYTYGVGVDAHDDVERDNSIDLMQQDSEPGPSKIWNGNKEDSEETHSGLLGPRETNGYNQTVDGIPPTSRGHTTDSDGDDNETDAEDEANGGEPA